MNDTVVIDSINYSTEAIQYVTLDHKTSLECQFLNWRKRRLAASFEKTAQSDCHWCLNEMKVGAKRKKQDEQADIRLFFRR